MDKRIDFGIFAMLQPKAVHEIKQSNCRQNQNERQSGKGCILERHLNDTDRQKTDSGQPSDMVPPFERLFHILLLKLFHIIFNVFVLQ